MTVIISPIQILVELYIIYTSSISSGYVIFVKLVTSHGDLVMQTPICRIVCTVEIFVLFVKITSFMQRIFLSHNNWKKTAKS